MGGLLSAVSSSWHAFYYTTRFGRTWLGPATGYWREGRQSRSGRLDIYTLSGRRIYGKDLHDLEIDRTHTTSWNGRDHGGDPVANGVYIMRMKFGGGSGGDVLWEDKIVKMR